MMAALHTMGQCSQALPLVDNLDLYFALQLRENHRAAAAISALARETPPASARR